MAMVGFLNLATTYQGPQPLRAMILFDWGLYTITELGIHIYF